MGKYDELRKIAAQPTSQRTADNIEAYRAAVTPVPAASEPTDLGTKYDFLRNPQKYVEQNKLLSEQQASQAAADKKAITSQVLTDTLNSVMKPTNTKTETKKTVDFKQDQANQKAAATAAPNLFAGKTLAPVTPNITNDIGSMLQGKVPAASLLQQTGKGPANASQIRGISEYDTREKRIDETNIPEVLKLPSRAMNKLAFDTPLGLAISRAFAGNSGVTSRDSTGNKTVDKITDVVNDLVTPLITPTGAPLGQGIFGSTYDATGKLLSGKAGQRLLQGASKMIPGSQNVAKVAATEGIAGSLQGVGFGLQQGQDSGNEIARNAFGGAAAGLVLGGASAALGELGTSLLSRFRKSGIPESEIAEIAPELLALPEANPRTVRKQLAGEIKTTPSGDTISTPYTFRLNEATPETAAATANRQAMKNYDPIELSTKYAQDVIDEYKTLKETNAKKISNKKLYEQARQNVDARRVTDDPIVESKLKDTNIKATEPAPYTEPVIRNPVQELSREQQIQNKVNAGEFLPQEDIDFLLSGKYDKSKAFPDETPTTSTYVKPKSELVPKTEIKPAKPKAKLKPVNKEVAATTEVAATKTPKKKVVGERGFSQTLKNSEKIPEGFTSKLDTKYEPTTNRGDLAKAEERLKDRADATRFILEDTKGGMTSEQSITAQRLIDTHIKEGNIQAAEKMADALLKESTRSAQFLQSLSTYNKLSPEGVYMVAKRYANKINETSSKIAKKAEVTAQMADDLQGLATINQKMTGVKDLSNDAVDILKRAKAGETLTDAETSVIQKFVEESKQFIKESGKEYKPKAPKIPKDKKVKDNVMKFLDAQEAAAKERLRAKGVRVSSTPLDIWADYAVIGAAKMGRNIINFADWSAQMVKDLGEDIRPQLKFLYEKSREVYDLSNKKVTSQSVASAERLTQKLINSKQLSEHEANSLLKLASQVDELSGEAKRVASQDLQVILQSLDNPSLGKKISSAQTQAQLLNPKTQVRNVLGNELFYRLERISKYVSTPIDIARSKITGSDRTVTFRTHNQGKYWENFIEGGSAGWRGVNINGIETQYDLSSPAFKGKYNPLKYTEKALGAALRSFDNAAYSRAMNKTLGELGTLDAINSGVKPSKEYVQEFIRNADENINKIASEYGKYATFQDNNALATGFTKFKRGLNFGKDFGLGDLIIKYPKTPGALLMRAVEYSPAGFLRTIGMIAKPMYKNGVESNPRAVVEGLSRAIVGSGGLSMLGYFLMDNKILTGTASGDKDIRSLQAQTGKGAYQVNLSALYRFVKSGFNEEDAKIKEGDKLYNYDWMQPVSVAIALGANVKGNIEGSSKKGVGSSAAGLIYDSTAGAVNTMAEQSLLKGVQDALSGYTGQTTTDKIVSIVADLPSSFVPTLSNQIKQSGDNTKRETYSPSTGEKVLNTVKAKIPGLAETLPKKYDTLGQEQTHYQDGNAFNIFANPGFPANYKLSDEARKIVDLIAATGDETLAPRVPGKTINGVKLTGKEYSRFSQLQGEETKRLVSELDTSMSLDDQSKAMEKILKEAAKSAKEKMVNEFPRLGD
ncbi:hypothetical protein NST48_01725 [Paenibacillus sp. FSL M7-0547]|uniref:hypothetical protein n=1 Tax=Paenibacillus sp. FSL M7-0547 TaxID=2954755 RepID=UPI0030FB92AB